MNAILPWAMGLVALLYASVGHAGATGYIAVMTLMGLPPQVIRPTALTLNVIVATIATTQFFRAGHFRGGLFWPLAMASIPCAAAGGAIDLPTTAFAAVVGMVLLISAVQLLRDGMRGGGDDDSLVAVGHRPPLSILVVLGGAIGLLSGLTGVGGGVFLTPALLALRVAPVRQVAAVTAPFILVNSLAGLAGGLVAGRGMAAISAPVVGAAMIGGAVGAHIGAVRLPVRILKGVLAAVLGFAGLKMLGLG
jgi:uncharacterized membrane protein YfcA